MTIPLIDIAGFDPATGDGRSAVVSQWRDALDSLGFVTIGGHGISDSLVTDIRHHALTFFEQSPDSKLRHAVDAGQRGATGYIPPLGENVGRTAAGVSAPDIVESLSFSDLVGHGGAAAMTEKYPGLTPEFLDAVERYAKAAYDLGLRLMTLSALALDLPADYFDSVYSPMGHKLRLAFYPDQLTDPVPGQLRNAAHTDFGGFTILLQDNAPGGLQVLLPDGQWLDVPSVPGTLIINTGDLLQRWTNDRWVSNVHRVINPPVARRGSSRRLSVVFFTGPRDDAEIACLPGCASPSVPARYPPITAGEHVRAKLRQTYGVEG